MCTNSNFKLSTPTVQMWLIPINLHPTVYWLPLYIALLKCGAVRESLSHAPWSFIPGNSFFSQYLFRVFTLVDYSHIFHFLLRYCIKHLETSASSLNSIFVCLCGTWFVLIILKLQGACDRLCQIAPQLHITFFIMAIYGDQPKVDGASCHSRLLLRISNFVYENYVSQRFGTVSLWIKRIAIVWRIAWSTKPQSILVNSTAYVELIISVRFNPKHINNRPNLAKKLY